MRHPDHLRHSSSEASSRRLVKLISGRSLRGTPEAPEAIDYFLPDQQESRLRTHTDDNLTTIIHTADTTKADSPRADKHTGAFACSVCVKVFFRKDHLHIHQGLHNPGRSPSESVFCGGVLATGQRWGCGRVFLSPDALDSHLSSVVGLGCSRGVLESDTMPDQDGAGEYDEDGVKTKKRSAESHDQQQTMLGKSSNGVCRQQRSKRAEENILI